VKGIRILLPFRSAADLLIRMVIFMDTSILFGRAVSRRVRETGIASLAGSWRLPKGVSILYLDLGTHKEAKELALMVTETLPRISDTFDAYGFEASEECFLQAQPRFAGRENVHLIRGALCHLPPPNGKLNLYKEPGDGLENSIYRSHYAVYEEVNAIRLSDWLREHNLDPRNIVCLLRMNIEGSEFDVIKDLVESGLAECIDGYFGMWDDLSKIDRQRDAEFRAYLAQHDISPFTFNGRDLESPLRMRAIEYEIVTAVRAGLSRVKRGER
jgi:FkbM family methyltransferase